MSDIPYKGDMHAHVPVVTRAFKTDVDTKGHTRPRRVPCLTIETHLHLPQNVWMHNAAEVTRTLFAFWAFKTLKTCSVSAFVGSAIFLRDEGEGGGGGYPEGGGRFRRWWRQLSSVGILSRVTSDT